MNRTNLNVRSPKPTTRYLNHFLSLIVKPLAFTAFLFIGLLAFADGTDDFITTWHIATDGETLTIPTAGGGYNYTVDWGDGSEVSEVTGNVSHSYEVAGTYTVSISGDFPQIYLFNSGQAHKLLTIEQWGTISWRSMDQAFRGCNNLTVPATDAPDLSRVTVVANMFEVCSAFNDPINHWDVSNVENFEGMFAFTPFNQPLDEWEMGSATNILAMFYQNKAFNQPIGDWDVSSVQTTDYMFFHATSFNQDLNWQANGMNITNMRGMFEGATAFNGDITGWDVSSVDNMAYMFMEAAAFNQDISEWETGNVRAMEGMFRASAFNQPIGDWDVSSVQTTDYMFFHATSFNQDLNWQANGMNITNMRGMFEGATAFNGDITGWDVSSVDNMAYMFMEAAAFNQDISEWETGNVRAMEGMFNGATSFDQNIGSWSLNSDVLMDHMLDDSGISCENYSAILTGWATNNTALHNRVFGSKGLQYNADALEIRQQLIDQGWTVSGDILIDGPCTFSTDAFVTSWETTEDGESITIPTTGTGYNYTVKWGDGTEDTGVTGDASHAYATPGTHIVQITGDFPRIYFNNSGDQNKIRTVEQWGTNQWSSMASAFAGCHYFTINATDVPDLSDVTDMSKMFYVNVSIYSPFEFSGGGIFIRFPSELNADLSEWDVSNVTNMAAMFHGARDFNSDLSSWNVSNVTNMSCMFLASAFNQDISSWNVSNVTDMSSMFHYNKVFNQDLSLWDVGKVTNMSFMFALNPAYNNDLSTWFVSNLTDVRGMFYAAQSFNQDLSSWDVSKVTDMEGMFAAAGAFNNDISFWNVANVANMNYMFYWSSSFSANLGNWQLNSEVQMEHMFDYSGMNCETYSGTLIGWEDDNQTPEGRVLGAEGIEYGFNGAYARDILIDEKGWTIYDDIATDNECFIFGGEGRVTKTGTDNTEVHEALDIETIMYPNPVLEQINIMAGEDKGELIAVTIRSLSGQVIKQGVGIYALDGQGTSRIYPINVSELATGTYIMEASFAKDTYIKQFIKE